VRENEKSHAYMHGSLIEFPVSTFYAVVGV